MLQGIEESFDWCNKDRNRNGTAGFNALTEASLQTLRLSRAKYGFTEDAEFLMRRVVDDMMERLSAVKRDFDHGLAVAGRTSFLASEMRITPQIADISRWEESVFIGDADRVATFDNMMLEPDSYNFVAAPLTLHWANDLPGVFLQLHRCLKEDGLMLATLPGPQTLTELRLSLLEAESEISGGAALRVDRFTDIRDAGGLLQRAGFALPVVDQEIITVRYSEFDGLIKDLRGFGATFQSDGKGKQRPLSRKVVAKTKEIYRRNFSDADGKLRATFQMIWLSGWKPHVSQQKPLKPGSAKTRLADALNVKEQKL